MHAEFAGLLEGFTLTSDQITFMRHGTKILIHKGGLASQETFGEFFSCYDQATDLLNNN